MGFTIMDMMTISEEKYEMQMVAGANGWANSISWLLMVEDTKITEHFMGKELAVTTGLGFDTEKKLLNLVKILDQHHAAGLVVNTGMYVLDIPQSVKDYCDEKDLPLLTAPWNIVMSEMIKDLTVRIFLQSQTDEQISASLIKAIESPHLIKEYREELSQAFAVDGEFQVVLFTTEDLGSMDTVDRKRIGYRLQIYLENISHNAHFFYYAGFFVLIFNEVDPDSTEEIIEGFQERARRRMPEQDIYVGVGSRVRDISKVSLSYRRAEYAAAMAKNSKINIVHFSQLGIGRLFYSVRDTEILFEMGEQPLRPIIEYDEKHHADLEQTLYLYLKYAGSVKLVSDRLYIHKNTIVYRINKIRELLEVDLDDPDEREKLFLACMIREGTGKYAIQ